MRRRPGFRTGFLLALVLSGVGNARGQTDLSLLPEEFSFQPALPINRVTLRPEGAKHPVSFYLPTETADSSGTVFLCQVRREEIAALRPLLTDSTRIVAPGTTETTRSVLTDPEAFWQAWWDERFDYYGQQVTRLPTRPLPITDWAKEGGTLEVAGLRVSTLRTPGVTREGVTYLVEIEGKKIGFSGNLILEGGRIPDLYSFQEAIPDAKVGAYHGYAGRLETWIDSLEKLAAASPDLLVPSQGPIISDPESTIRQAIDRSRAIYANYLSTNALHWYFGEERMGICAEKVLGEGVRWESMPLAEHVDLPSWIQHIGTTKLLISDSGSGFVLDVGSPKALETLKKAVEDGLVSAIEGIWVTHRHNDHTRSVAEAQKAFGCPVYAIDRVAEALVDPGAHFSPGISANSVREVTILDEGEEMTWREFRFTARFFPGQMLDHGGLLVEPPTEKGAPVFFIGDSFSPSGIDDYCLMNRNLLREDLGYLRCFQIVREELPEGAWLVNQHIPHLFRFRPDELDFLEQRYRERIELLRDFTPWDDPNFAVDEQWAWCRPYGQEAKAGQNFAITVRIENHSKQEREFQVTPHAPPGISWVEPKSKPFRIGAQQRGEITFRGKIGSDAGPGVRVATFSLSSEDLVLPHWCEALIRIPPP